MTTYNIEKPNTELRMPPQNLEAEEGILGGILLDSEAIGKVADQLPPDAFYVKSHQEIYRAALTLYSQNKPTDLMTVSTWLNDHSKLERIGGQDKIARLVDRTISAVNVEQYALLVLDKYLRRRLIKAGSEITELGYQVGAEVEQVLDQSQQKIFSLGLARPNQGLIPIGDTLVQTFQEIETHNQGLAIPGIPCGFYDLDAITGGFQSSDLIIVAGRPSMGKTSFALNIGQRIANQHKLPVAIFSLEMSKEQLIMRMLSTEARIEANRLRAGRINQHEWEPLNISLASLSELPIFIDDSPNPTVMQMRTQARRLQTESGGKLGMIIIDYLQLMEGGSDNRVQELSKITRSLKGLARELNVPVIALSQLSRAVESRTNKRPMLSDLRESGCLTGESLITLADSGKQVPIRDLVGKSGFEVWAFNESTKKLEQAIVSNAFSTGIKFVYKLTTRLGRSIRATGNHKFLTFNGWKRLDELEPGQDLCVPVHPDLSKDIYWDEIVSIEPDGEEEVYDLTVPRHHNFVANNIVVHNSIEQDADLVIMLYRDEYYNTDSPDRAIAEAIVCKHRNGPTGTVKFLFDANFTRFENLAKPAHLR